LDEEVRYHIDRQTALNQAAGMTVEEARQTAMREFGGVEQRKEECRDARGMTLIDTTLHDLRYSVRVLASNRTFTVLSIMCLSLAIGTNTTVFTFVNALLLQPLPLADPAQLVSVHETRHGDPGSAGPVSYPNFLDWKAHASEVAEMAAQRSVKLRVSDGGAPDAYTGALVSWNLFSVLGIRPARGRGFLEQEDHIGGAPVVLLSHTLWRQRYHEDPAMIGREITVNGTRHTVIGIMPPELSQIAMNRVLRGARLWIPIGSVEHDGRRDQRTLSVYARFGNGVTRDSAGARLSTVGQTLERMYPENDGSGVTIRTLRSGFSPTTRAMLLMMMGAVTFVLVIACANVANLTLARVMGRRREIATRLALGAGRSRIVRQLLTESVLVAVASIPLGIAFAYWGRNLVLGGQPSPEMHAEISIDGQVLIYTIAVAMMASLLSGLLPALHGVRRLRHTMLTTGGGRENTSGPSHTRLTHGLIVGEISLALILVVGASLFVQSFRNALLAEGGFDTSRILNVRLAEEGARTPGSASRRVNEAVDQLMALPGVAHAAAANLMPLRDGGDRAAVIPDGLQGTPGKPPTVLLGGVTTDFFSVLNVPIVQGRMFTDDEGRSRAAVAIVNKTMARRLWPGENPIGRRFVRAVDKNAGWFTIVGVSDDILTWDVSDRPQPIAYVPYAHVPVGEPGLFIRASGDPSVLAPSVRAAIHAMDPTQPLLDVRTMTEVHRQALSRMQTLAALFVVVGGIALFLGATGVYGVLSYFVSQRTYEIGIRAALGADRRTLVSLFVRQGMTMAFAGIALGMAGAWALARVVRGLLHEVDPTDPLSFAGAALVLAAVGFLATYVPARRAANVDPLIAIRN
jgi:putative ABC transport system permease protein